MILQVVSCHVGHDHKVAEWEGKLVFMFPAALEQFAILGMFLAFVYQIPFVFPGLAERLLSPATGRSR